MKKDNKEAQKEAIQAIMKFAKSGMVKRKKKPEPECEEDDEEEMEA